MDTDSAAQDYTRSTLQLLGRCHETKRAFFIRTAYALGAAPSAAAQNAPGLSPAEGLEILKKSDATLIPEMCSYDLTLTTTEKAGVPKDQQLQGL